MISYVKNLNQNAVILGVFCVLIATVGLSLKAIFIKLLYLTDPSIDAISILALRFFLALPFFIILLIYANKNQPGIKFTRSHLKVFLLLGMLGFYVSAILDFTALAYIPAGLERLILFLYPTFVVLISVFLKLEKLNRSTYIALAICYFGLVVVFAEQANQLSPSYIKGSALVLGAAIVFAIYTVASVKPIKEHGSIRFTAYAMFAASFATLAHAFGVHGLEVFHKSLDVYLLIFPMAIFSTVMPLILMAEGIKRIGASKTSIIATSGPVITISLAYMLLGETIGIMQAIGGVMIISGVYFVARRKH